MNEKQEEKRPMIRRTYAIFVDQHVWLKNSSLNQAKHIRKLIDDDINKVHDKRESALEDIITELTMKIEELNAVIVALGEKQ